MERANIPRAIAAAFGGIVQFADACRHRSHGTVYGWIKSGRIPDWRRHEIIDAARRNKVTLPSEFIAGTVSEGCAGSDVRNLETTHERGAA